MRLTGRTKSAELVNGFLNNPLIAQQAEKNENYAFFGEFGGMLCVWVAPGIYGLTVEVAKGTNPSWTKQMAEEVFTLMFTETDAFKLLGSVKSTNQAALKLVRGLPGVKEKKDVEHSSFECTIGKWLKATSNDVGTLSRTLKGNQQGAKANLLLARKDK